MRCRSLLSRAAGWPNPHELMQQVHRPPAPEGDAFARRLGTPPARERLIYTPVERAACGSSDSLSEQPVDSFAQSFVTRALARHPQQIGASSSSKAVAALQFHTVRLAGPSLMLRF